MVVLAESVLWKALDQIPLLDWSFLLFSTYLMKKNSPSFLGKINIQLWMLTHVTSKSQNNACASFSKRQILQHCNYR